MVSEKLLSEFQAEKNSFLFSIKTRLVWRHEKFVVLLKIMLKYCEEKCREDESDNMDESEKLDESNKAIAREI